MFFCKATVAIFIFLTKGDFLRMLSLFVLHKVRLKYKRISTQTTFKLCERLCMGMFNCCVFIPTFFSTELTVSLFLVHSRDRSLDFVHVSLSCVSLILFSISISSHTGNIVWILAHCCHLVHDIDIGALQSLQTHQVDNHNVRTPLVSESQL